MVDTMADTLTRMTIADFLAWEARQEGRHEFVRGRIVAMVGGTRRHNAIGLKVAAYLSQQLKGRRCQAYGGDMKILIPNGNSRYADALVDCGPMRGEDVAATEPTVVVEVLSKSTKYDDQTEKLDDYQSIPSMRHILHLSQKRIGGELWTRSDDGWLRTPLAGADAIVELSALGLSVPLGIAYEDVSFDESEQANDA
jgi:Uma2 family endonuclease